MTTTDTLALLIALEEQIVDPATRHSSRVLNSILSDELLEFTASGRAFDKASIVSILTAESGGATAEMTNHGYELRPLAEDVVLLTYRNVTSRAGAADAHSLRSSIWNRIGAQWQLVFHQGTPTVAE
ncbi:DUF4440 domain-containing protein [Phenylobacterium sp.]|uniref:nuclear transport factor 2 family protein n=1 Tax=Phenylobacterium sp. TaxID=1871053 RepID=UPI0011F71A00|nr:DUF4440 domain-containing protein [Phenylobacterium sp.]THD51711.1 MAG: DUF4440 domain-containing protein [Phenylobacterium sp.]